MRVAWDSAFLVLLLVCLGGKVDGEDVCHKQDEDMQRVMGWLVQYATETHTSISLLEEETSRLNHGIESLKRENEKKKTELDILKTNVYNYLTLHGCDDGWKQYNGSCYLVSNDTFMFYEAQEYCQQHGANLVHVDNSRENDFIKLTLVTNDVGYSMGLTDKAAEGEWRWVDTNDMITFSDWGPREPNNHGNENCVEFMKEHNFKWNDFPCAMGDRKTICEKRISDVEIGIADIEFNFVIGKDGRAYEGRGWNRIGYNTPYWDEVSLSFSVMGSYSSKRPDTNVMQTMKRMIDCGVKLGKITGDYKLYGHRDINSDAYCPGLELYDVIKTWAHYDSNTPLKHTP